MMTKSQLEVGVNHNVTAYIGAIGLAGITTGTYLYDNLNNSTS